MIQAYLLEVGIQTKLNLVERSLYTAMTYDGTAFDMEIMSPGGIDLPSAWQSSYDMTSYNGKDASGRSDEVLTDMIKKASTNEGFTDENINAVHEYVLEHVYDYGICQPQQCDVIRTDIGLKEMVTMAAGGVDYAACVYSK